MELESAVGSEHQGVLTSCSLCGARVLRPLNAFISEF